MKNIPKEIYLNLGIPKRVFDITRDDIDFKQLNGVGCSNNTKWLKQKLLKDE